MKKQTISHNKVVQKHGDKCEQYITTIQQSFVCLYETTHQFTILQLTITPLFMLKEHLAPHACIRYLSFEIVLPFLRFQGLEAATAVRGDGHAEGPVGSGGQLRSESHRGGPGTGVLPLTHYEVWTGT